MSPQVPKLYIVGGGAIGSYLAARLCQEGKLARGSSRSDDPVLICRTPESAQLASQGLRLQDEQGQVSDPISVRALCWAEQGPLPSGATVLVTTKTYHLVQVLGELRARIDDTHPVFLAQNGLGVLEDAQKLSPSHSLWGRMICRFGARFTPEGYVRGVGITEGVEAYAGPGSETALDALAGILGSAGIPLKKEPSLATLEWRKGIWNISLNGLCALLGVANGVAIEDSRLRILLEKLFWEASELARRSSGVELGKDDLQRVIEASLRVASNFNSTLQDLRSGRPTEIPWLNGYVVRKGRELSLETPLNLMISNLLEFLVENRTHSG